MQLNVPFHQKHQVIIVLHPKKKIYFLDGNILDKKSLFKV